MGTSLAQSLTTLAIAIRNINMQNGWYDEARPFSADIALLHSEVSEAYEGYRIGDWANVREEMADILIRLLDTCDRYNIDLAHEVTQKLVINAVRGRRHGGKKE